MIASMTGFGRAEITKRDITAIVEVRGVNSRYLDVTTRLPRLLSQREKDIKEIVRSCVNRGNLVVSVTVAEESDGTAPVAVNKTAAKAYIKLLNDLRKAAKIREKVRLEHLLKFSEVFDVPKEVQSDKQEWSVVEEALRAALDGFNTMRHNEGGELAKDLERRITWLSQTVEKIEQMSRTRIPEERKRLHERISQLIEDKVIIDQNRLELEIALLADKLDVTEECVRFRSHTKFFLETIANSDSAGRKLNFLVQEINREANTIGSKTNDTEIAHLVVQMKEELEKIREQLQNIE
ncbi:MAG: YicC/YloC family endoribonuclease [Ignavibacteria bacterium]|nr:YicC/YloC family endoribonuclease [Ignavibacteria bacterium]